MTLEQLTEEGWVMTDGSDKTLQFGRRVGNNTWGYREWTDKPWEPYNRNREMKLEFWDSSNWNVEEIDLWDYTEEEIQDHLSPYGYEINYYCKQDFNNTIILTIKDDSYMYSVEDSIQLACECIFEQTN